MKSIPLALSWEFWRQAGVALFITVACLSGLIAMFYGGLQIGRVYYVHDTATLTSLHAFNFIFVVVGLAPVICHSTASPQYRFTLPVSIRASVFVPMINGAIATVIGYLTVALLVNGLFNAQWSLLKPTIIAVCMISICQAVAWMFRSSANLRGAIVAIVSTLLGVVVIYVNENLFSFVLLTLARRGQLFSMTAIGRWPLAILETSFGSGIPGTTPMPAELWSEWTQRGRVMLAGPMLIAAALCGFFLSGRFEWGSAREAIVGLTWMQVMIGSAILGLFVGHVGERFDFHEYSATRPLSDMQLADVKLHNALKSFCWAWVTWTIGVAVAVGCLAVVGQGPTGWGDIVPPELRSLVPVAVLLLVPLSWTLTSVGVSVSILRPWFLTTVFVAIGVLPCIPLMLVYFMPASERAIWAGVQWSWIGLTIILAIAIYTTAFRLRLITAKRIGI
ncbi:MAG: hypothetical protein HYV60_04530, partial [Planctomycetia bacterium]|nr:hypothetical protein [Planctomycetia bacterium]